MKYMMDLDQFMFLTEQAEKNDAVTSLNKTSVVEGVIDTHDVKLSYRYDSGSGALFFEPIQKHTLAAKIASDAMIEKHVDEIIAEVLNAKHQLDIENAKKAVAEPVKPASTIVVKPTIPATENKESN